MATDKKKTLDVPCTLCGKRRYEIEKGGDWCEVKAWGPNRRCHEVCFLEVMDVIRDIPDDEFMRMIEEREAKRTQEAA